MWPWIKKLMLAEHIHTIDPGELQWAPDHSCMEGFVYCTGCGAMGFVLWEPDKEDGLWVLAGKGKWRFEVVE